MKTAPLPLLAAAWFAAASALTGLPTALAQSGKDTPSAYALQLPIEKAPPAQAADGLFRLAVPAQALVQLQASGYADLRVFDARGVVLPMALTAAPPNPLQQQSVFLPAYPILGAAMGNSGGQNLSLRIEQSGDKRIVQLDSTGQVAAGAQKVVGALLDARALPGLTQPAVALDLRVALPNAQPIRFVLQASGDLQNWQTLADAVLYRVEGTPMAASSSRLGFAAVDLKGQYLRLTWSGAAGADVSAQDVAVSVQGATVIAGQTSSTAPRLSAGIATTLTDAHELSFALPFATPVVALDIGLQGANVVTPVRVLGRSERSQPWRLLASGVAYQISRNGVVERSLPLELGLANAREFKIEADRKTPGFAAPLSMAVLMEPVQIVFVASGNPPYTLAAGQSQAKNGYLPVQSLIPGYQSGAEHQLPLLATVLTARNTGSSPAAVFVEAPTPGKLPPTRNLVLWGVLIAGALALGLMAWTLLRQNQKPP